MRNALTSSVAASTLSTSSDFTRPGLPEQQRSAIAPAPVMYPAQRRTRDLAGPTMRRHPTSTSLNGSSKGVRHAHRRWLPMNLLGLDHGIDHT
jgi:hypothetical protein